MARVIAPPIVTPTYQDPYAVQSRDLLNERTDRAPAVRNIKPRPVKVMTGLQELGAEVTPASTAQVVGAYGGPSPGNVGRRAKYANKLLEQGMDFSPIGSGSWLEPLLRNVVPAGIGGYMQGQATKDEEAGRAAAKERYKALLAGGQPTTGAAGGLSRRGGLGQRRPAGGHRASRGAGRKAAISGHCRRKKRRPMAYLRAQPHKSI